MPKFTVTKECTFRFGKKEPAAHLFSGAVVEVEAGRKIPPWFEPKDKTVKTEQGEAADNGGIPDIRSKKEICAELDDQNVVYKKTMSIKELEDLLADAKEARKKKED